MKNLKKYKTGFSKKALLCAVCATYGAGISGASFNHANVADESYIIQQDGKTVTGVVMDNMGPVIGANVLVKGTTNGVITDFDGKFTLSNVPENAVLQISFIGYTTKEIKVAGKKDFSITLVEDAKTLEEVVVVGYGSQKKVNLTGAVARLILKFLNHVL